MGYPPRIEIPGHVYHVNGNCVDGGKLFRDDEDRTMFLISLRRELRRSEWRCIAYSLMSTHFHVLLRLEKCTLSSGFQRLNSAYARWFNRKYGRRGALWQRRFHDVLIESDAHLLEVNRYVALNAPRAGMSCRAEDYAWCSYGSAIGAYPPDPLIDEHELLGPFGTRPDVARRRLQAFVEESDPRKRRSQRRD